MSNREPLMERFVEHYIIHGNADAAYRFANRLDTDVGTRNSLNWVKHPYVVRRLEEERQKAMSKTSRTFDGHLSSLEELRDLAKDSGKISAAINAEVARGKALGFYNHKRKVQIVDPKDVDTDQLLQQLKNGHDDFIAGGQIGGGEKTAIQVLETDYEQIG